MDNSVIVTTEKSLQYNKKIKEIYCGNCGKKGHIYKKCHFPIMSLGIICIKFDKININNFINKAKKTIIKSMENGENFDINILPTVTSNEFDQNLKFTMIRRRHSLGFVEFIRGKYSFDDIEYLFSTFSIMTIKERENINTKAFDELWLELWNIRYPNNSHKNEYEISKKKFNLLKESVHVTMCNIPVKISLQYLINNTTSQWHEPEWGFPKGRRNLRELDVNCAIREFSEETNFYDNEYELINIDPISELFIGSNSVRYKHIYYIGQCSNNKTGLKINIKNKSQVAEIGAIGWFTYNDAKNLIRNYNIEKKNVLNNLYSMLKILIVRDNNDK